MSLHLATLPARTRAFLEHGAPEGQRNVKDLSRALQRHAAGYSEADAVRLVQDASARSGLAQREAAAAGRAGNDRKADLATWSIPGGGVYFRCATCAEALPAEQAGAAHKTSTVLRVWCADCERIRQQQTQNEVRL